MMRMRLLLSLIVLAAIFSDMSAKNVTHPVSGYVLDGFTGLKMGNVTVLLMTADSVVISTATTFDDPDGEYTGVYKLSVSKPGRYILRASCLGYETCYQNFVLKSSREPTVFVKPFRMMQSAVRLGEVQVKGSKIKMVVSGDTIVYNADAFNLAEGSMLHALISRLPGTRLTRDGQIFVNGKYVESLLVNGRDFFNGNAMLALENLPAYTVKKIKVYDEQGAASRIMGRDMGDKHYVMDVRLKKEYSTQTFGNAEAGAGTESRYKAKGFGMGLSEETSLLGFLNANNLNDGQDASLEGEWTPQATPHGVRENKKAGASVLHFLGSPRNFLSSQNSFSHSSDDNQEKSSSQLYFAGGDVWKKAQSKSLRKETRLGSRNMLNYEAGSWYDVTTLDMCYSWESGSGTASQSTSDTFSLLNLLSSRNTSKSRRLTFSSSTENGLRIGPDMLRWKLEADHDRQSSDHFLLDEAAYTASPGSPDRRDNYRDGLSLHWNAAGQCGFSMQWPSFSVSAEYEYRFRTNETEDLLYRLDRLGGADSTRFGMLPSTAAALAGVQDLGNSYHYHERQNHHQFQLRLSGTSSWGICLPVHYVHKALSYHRQGHGRLSRHALFLNPNAHVSGRIGVISYSAEAGIKSDIPDMSMQVNYRDDSNPLEIYEGNDRLKDTHDYDLSGSLRISGSHQQLFSASLAYHQQDNAVAFGKEIDMRSGITTIRPVSVNGNWNCEGKLGYSRAIGRGDKASVDNQLRYGYLHGVDMNRAAEGSPSGRSIVNNHRIDERLSLNLRMSSHFEIGLHGESRYYITSSAGKDFQAIHAGDHQIGFNTTLSLPLKLQLHSDFTLYAHRGYQQAEMNTSEWVWNAQLSRYLLKDVLLVKLQCFDILHQLSTQHYYVDSQGRTETWCNSIPSYWLLSLQYQFKKAPKKRLL